MKRNRKLGVVVDTWQDYNAFRNGSPSFMSARFMERPWVDDQFPNYFEPHYTEEQAKLAAHSWYCWYCAVRLMAANSNPFLLSDPTSRCARYFDLHQRAGNLLRAAKTRTGA